MPQTALSTLQTSSLLISSTGLNKTTEETVALHSASKPWSMKKTYPEEFKLGKYYFGK